MIETKITMLDTIWIQHGKYMDDKELTKKHTRFAFAQEEVNQALDEKRGRCLGGVYPSWKNEYWVVF